MHDASSNDVSKHRAIPAAAVMVFTKPAVYSAVARKLPVQCAFDDLDPKHLPPGVLMPGTATLSLPPRAQGLPFLGSAPRIARQGMLPFLHEQWRALGDTFEIKVGPRRLVAIVHPQGVEQVLATRRENYIKGTTYDTIRLLTGEGLLTLEGDAWLKRRRLEHPAFHRENIKRLVGTMARVTNEWLARLRQRLPHGGNFEAHQQMMHLTLEVVGETLFGQPLGESSTNTSARAFGDALALISDRGNAAVQLPLAIPTPNNVRLRRALKILDDMVFAVIAQARRGNSDRPAVLLSMLLEAKDADSGTSLNDLELRNEVITLFLAGHETTALLLSWGLTLLGEHPDALARMREEVDTVLGGREPTTEDLPKLVYVRQVIDEILRLRGPTWAVARDTLADDEICGHRIRAGDVAMPISYLTHRHPDFWDEPERFDPDRFAPERTRGRHHWAYYPFSLGPRICIGNTFSLIESQIVFAMLLQQADLDLSPLPHVIPNAQITTRPSGPIPVGIRWR
jgi:cytochrome P450